MNFNEIKSIENEHFFDVFSRLDLCIVDAKDNTLIDISGKEYTDFLSGIAVCCLGYSDEGYKEVLKNQIDNIIHTSNYFYIESQSKLLKNLCNATGMDRAFISNSGAEAVEGAIKLARKYFYNKGQQKTEIITFNDSFHGRTLATLAATGQEKFHKPFMPLIQSFKYADYKDINSVENLISKKTCAVMIEPVIGEGGVIPAGQEFYQKVREICDKNDILMIADEIQTGIGRTGKFLASQKYNVKPDIVILAKSLGNGLPIGAFLATSKVAQGFSKSDHGSTYGGNHLACAGANYVVEKITSTDIMKENIEKSKYFADKLNGLLHYNCIKETRGEGLMQAIEFTNDYSAGDFHKKMIEKGFISATAGNNTLRFLPPYTIEYSQIDDLVKNLDETLKELS